jgi:hypothetical protein
MYDYDGLFFCVLFMNEKIEFGRKIKGEVGVIETWGKVEQPVYFLVKHVLKYVSLKNKTTVSLCSMFHSSPILPLYNRQDTQMRDAACCNVGYKKI